MTFTQLYQAHPDPKPFIVLVYCLGDTNNNKDHYQRFDPDSCDLAEAEYEKVTSWPDCYTASLCFEIKGTDHSIVNDLFDLESVGTALGLDGIGYPLHTDGTPDLEAGVHLDDTTEEWFENLSKNDRAIVEQIKSNLK